MEKYTVGISYYKNDEFKVVARCKLSIERVTKLEKIYQRAEKLGLISSLRFSKDIYLYTVMAVYLRHGKNKTNIIRDLTNKQVDRLRAIFQKAQKKNIYGYAWSFSQY